MIAHILGDSRSGHGRRMRRKVHKFPRRRAKQGRSRETVEVVLEAAAQVLLREGYARATTNRIAERAGVSVGTIYQYFGGKDEVFDTLIQRYFADVLSRLQGLRSDPLLPLDQTLRELTAAGIRAQHYGPGLLRALERVPGAVFRRRLSAAKKDLIEFVRSLLEAHRRELRVRDLDLAATLMVNAAEGIGYNASPEEFNDELADELALLFSRYVLISPPP